MLSRWSSLRTILYGVTMFSLGGLLYLVLDDEREDLKLAAKILLPIFVIEPFWWLLQAGKEACLRWCGF